MVIEATPQLSEIDSKKIIKEVNTKPNYRRILKLKGIINMNKEIELSTVSEILRKEFMEPFGISAYRLAKDINVPVSRIQAILSDNRKITIDTSIRLGRYFGVSYEYFLNIQNAIDIRKVSDNMPEDIKSISVIFTKKKNNTKTVDKLNELDDIITDALDKSENLVESQTLRWVLDKISELS